VSLHVAHTLAASYPDRMKVPGRMSKMVEAGMLGRKSGRGFYLHEKGKEARPNASVAGGMSPIAPPDLAKTGLRGSGLSRKELQERMVLLMINEAARCLEEQVVTAPEDVDFAMIMGTGFAPFRGGPLRYADTLGTPEIVGAMERLVSGGGSHFAPCALLRTMAKDKTKFYNKS
jgi:3-hydroxyacyl-CoA dehydrogenase/enoyl-CoA hydratase/3-hydroxybutyryl-CoA epimerase